jgi:hypothetical protein
MALALTPQGMPNGRAAEGTPGDRVVGGVASLRRLDSNAQRVALQAGLSSGGGP